MQRLGGVIRSLRLAGGVSQAELAQSIDVSASLLSMIESGRREPTLRVLRLIADRLGLAAGVLFAAALAQEAGESGNRALREVTETLIDAAKKQVLAHAMFQTSAEQRADSPIGRTRSLVASRARRTR